jgi:hypothetical protein
MLSLVRRPVSYFDRASVELAKPKLASSLGHPVRGRRFACRKGLASENSVRAPLLVASETAEAQTVEMDRGQDRRA